MTATATLAVRARLSRPSLRFVALGALVASVAVAAGLFATGSFRDGGTATVSDAEAAQLREYREAIRPLTQDGATVVGLGLRPGVGDVTAGTYPSEVLVAMADGWTASLENVRTGMDGIVPPVFLADAHWLYLRAIDGYIHAANALRSAAAAEGEQRERLVALAASLGRSADLIYDRADAEVAAHASRLGDDTPTKE